MRRTFLETLIQELKTETWIPQKKWDERSDALSNRRRVTETRTVPKPTKLGTAIAISVFAVPFGSSLISAALKDGVTLGWGLPPQWTFIIGCIFTFAPFIVLLANGIVVLSQRLFGKSGSDKASSKSGSAKVSNWAILLSSAITETRTETVESPNPTSIEFEAYFAEMMRDALDNQSDRRLLLVLDNLDRVDPENALAIWSTLQTFLQDRQHRQEKWFKQLWVLVPFDPVGLRKLWDNRQNDTVDESSNNGEAVSRPASDSFLDKSFQIRFSVPPAVLSDWKAFLYKLVEQALPDHNSGDRHLIFRVFDESRQHNGDSPTPRELKLFANQVGAIHRQWQHTFPISHIAYFVVESRNHRSLIERLRNSLIPVSGGLK